MARIRTIKPSFFTSLTIANLTLEQRLTFIGLWTHVDDNGRCEYDPRLIKAALWPLDDRSPEDVHGDIVALTEASLIAHYILSERSYLVVCGWREHQKINRPTPTSIPGPESGQIVPLTCGNEDSLRAHGGLTESSLREGKGKEGKGRESEPPPRRIDVERLLEALVAGLTANDVKPTITDRWRNDLRLILDKDGREMNEAISVIKFATTDKFWKSNILSASKLREKYDTLRLQMPKNATYRRPTAHEITMGALYQ